jgi:hypothetical protein
LQAISFSRTGQYAPSFRFDAGSVYDTEGSKFFLADANLLKTMVAVGASKISKFMLKNFVGHTVHCQVDELKELSTIFLSIEQVEKRIDVIIQNQQTNPRYDYASHEQIEIDRLVYEAYGLNGADVEEVENWYARRYPRLSAAQKANLRALGKGDDYLELYGLGHQDSAAEYAGVEV